MKINEKITHLTVGQLNSLRNAVDLAEWELAREQQEQYTHYKHEAGVIVSEANVALAKVVGSVGMVSFPEEVIWDLHKARPGYVQKLAHSHPPKMSHASGRDLQTLETWAWALHPFPARLSVITLWDRNDFVETTYLATLEPKELWTRRGKGTRECTSEVETVRHFKPTLLDRESPADAWLLWIIEESYGKARRLT